MTDTTSATVAYMVRCRCGVAARVDVPAERLEKQVREGGIVGVPGSAWFRTVHYLAPAWPADSLLLATIRDGGCRASGRCWTCGRKLKIDELHATYSPEHECDGRCLAAKGPNCECSCHGANHGRGLAA